MKKEFSLLFQTLLGHETLHNWSVAWVLRENISHSKCAVKLRFATVLLCASRISPFSPSLPNRNGS